MAAATAVVSRRGTDQFRGLFSDTWSVVATLNASSLADGAGETTQLLYLASGWATLCWVCQWVSIWLD